MLPECALYLFRDRISSLFPREFMLKDWAERESLLFLWSSGAVHIESIDFHIMEFTFACTRIGKKTFCKYAGFLDLLSESSDKWRIHVLPLLKVTHSIDTCVAEYMTHSFVLDSSCFRWPVATIFFTVIV